MDAMTWVELIIAVVAGILTCIPLVIKLIEHVQASAREKNWPEIMQLVMDLMADAEKMFDDGESRKEWVMNQIVFVSEHVDYDINMAVVSNMIDAMCTMSKFVNVHVKEPADAQS